MKDDINQIPINFVWDDYIEDYWPIDDILKTRGRILNYWDEILIPSIEIVDFLIERTTYLDYKSL